MDFINKKDMIKGQQYVCNARNFTVGTWNGESFNYMRNKFGHVFPDVEYHWDDGAPYGTVKPLEVINNE